MTTTSLRTQIMLPKDLRAAIDRQRGLAGESLAEFLRQAARDRLAREKKKRADLKRLAEEVIGAAKKGAGKGIAIEKWQHDLRKAEDEQVLAKLGIDT